MTLTRFEFTDRARPLLQVGLGSTEIGDGVGVWDVSLWDAPGATWNGDEPLWRDVSCDAITAHIDAGRGRITDPFPVGTADVLVSNASGWADPSLEFEIDSEPGYISFDGGLGELTIPDAPALDLPGDFTILMRVWLAAAPPTSWEMLRKWDSLPGYGIQVFNNADFNITLSPDGSITEDFTTTALPPTVGAWRWVAFAFDSNDGAGGHKGTWWYGGNDHDPFAWQLIETATNPGTFSLNGTTSLLRLGGLNFNGRFSHLELRNGHGGLSGGNVMVGGSAVFKLDGWQLGASDVGAATLTAATGQTITVFTSGGSTPTVVPAVNPAADPTVLKLRPGRPIRIGVQHETLGARWRFNGFIDEILPRDDPEDWSTVTLRCIDALGEAGRAKLKTDVETGASEQARTRFARILNAIKWPTTKRLISTSAIRPLYAAELDGQVVDLLRQTAESEGGWAFGDDQGRVVLQHRDWLYYEIGEGPDGIIGNFGGAGSELLLENGGDLLLEQSDEVWLEDPGDEVCPGVWERAFARGDIATQVTLDRDFPTGVTPTDPAIANDFPAQVLYGIEPYERSDLWTLNFGDLQQNAGRILATRTAALSMPRIRAVSISAETSDPETTEIAVDLLSQLSIFTPSRYRCRLRTDRGTVFDATFFAVGVTEDISADAWTAEISLDRSRPFEVLDPADYVWDTARWDHSLWN